MKFSAMKCVLCVKKTKENDKEKIMCFSVCALKNGDDDEEWRGLPHILGV